jgi:hypothetical protein
MNIFIEFIKAKADPGVPGFSSAYSDGYLIEPT